jgi:hypothetical protein
MQQMFRTSSLALSLLALTALLALAPAALAAVAPQPVAILNPSADFPAASGKAKFDLNLGALQFVVEVDGVPQLAGATLDVLIGGIKAGTTTVDALGNGRFVVDVGPTSPVWEIPAGTAVAVQTDAGVVVISGTSL